MIDKRTRKGGWVRWVAAAGVLAVGVLAIQATQQPAAAKPTASAKPAAGPLAVDVIELAPEAHALNVTATGQLAPMESVDVVSELSRRLLRVHKDEGATVKKGDVIFEVDASDLLARRARLRVSRDLAARILERREAHAGSGAISPHEIDVARTEVNAVNAEMHEVSVQLAKTQIRAPFDGVLGTRNVSVGAWVTPEVVLTTLYDTSRFKIDFTLPERYASHLAVGGAIAFSANGVSRKGTISVVEPSAEAGSRSIAVRGLVEGGDGLVAGTFATVTLKLEPRNALFVPTIAVEASPSGHSLWLLSEGKAVARVVEIGERTAEHMEITSGVVAGDKVIVSNLLRLKDGAPVVVQP